MGERALLLLGDRLPPGDGGDLEGERSERWALDFLLRGIEYMTPHRTRAHVQAGVGTAPRVCCASRQTRGARRESLREERVGAKPFAFAKLGTMFVVPL